MSVALPSVRMALAFLVAAYFSGFWNWRWQTWRAIVAWCCIGVSWVWWKACRTHGMSIAALLSRVQFQAALLWTLARGIDSFGWRLATYAAKQWWAGEMPKLLAEYRAHREATEATAATTATTATMSRPNALKERLLCLFRQADVQAALGECFRDVCVHAGVAFVKFSQLICLRDKEFAPAFLKPLKTLQSHVPPHMSWKVVRRLLPTRRSLLTVEPEAFACGCGAQVHAGFQRLRAEASATKGVPWTPVSASSTKPPCPLKPCPVLRVRKVALKVKSIYLEQTIEDSFATLAPFCSLLIRLGIFYCRPEKIDCILADVKESLTQQLDLRREAANQSYLRRRFLRDDHRDDGTGRLFPIVVPQVIPSLCNEHVLGMQHMEGVSLEEAVRRLSRDQKQRLAETLVHLFYMETFMDYYLDPDNHGGNFLVYLGDLSKDEIVLIKLDCGLVYRIPATEAQMLARFCLPFLEKDAEAMGAWFYERLIFAEPEAAAANADPQHHQAVRQEIAHIVGDSLCCDNPSWLRCAKQLTDLFDKYGCNMNSDADHFLFALGHLETTASLLIDNNIAKWMIQNGGDARKVHLRNFAFGEAPRLEVDVPWPESEAEDEDEDGDEDALAPGAAATETASSSSSTAIPPSEEAPLPAVELSSELSDNLPSKARHFLSRTRAGQQLLRDPELVPIFAEIGQQGWLPVYRRYANQPVGARLRNAVSGHL
jgi:predicted unusual protein kinase regulating ubiquinone biosynthesis (AarF/ABC1/UbiB family)